MFKFVGNLVHVHRFRKFRCRAKIVVDIELAGIYMGKILFRLILLIAAAIGVLMIIGSFLPRDFEFETSIEIAAAPEEVFVMVNSLPNWQHWSTFNEERVAGLEVEYGAIVEGVGAAQKWSDQRGEGKLWITDNKPNHFIEYNLEFQNFPIMKSRFEISESEGSSKIRWSSEGSLPRGPFYGFFAFLFPAQMVNQYDHSLNQLKTVLEK